MMNPVWFMLMLAIPDPGSNYDGGEVMMTKKIYESQQACVDDIDETIKTNKHEPRITRAGIVCLPGVVRALNGEDL